jgi:hypothetical protein
MEQQSISAVVQALQVWRAAHPQETCDEIDAAVQRQFARLQAEVVADLSHAAHAAAAHEAPPPRCEQGARPMQAHGPRTRRVPTRQGQAVRLQRAYSVCPACGAGRFPPG